MEDNFDDLQRLLRLKRHETPPPDFMEDFLREFHQRQRAEMLKRPLWRLAIDRFEGALPNFQIQRYAYAGSFAVILFVAGVSAKHAFVPASVAPANAAFTTASASARTNDSALASAPVGLVSGASRNVNVLPVAGTEDDQPPMRFHAPAASYATRSPIYAQRPKVSLADLDFDHPLPRTAAPAMTARNPRYVLDAQPVSYEQPESF